MKIIFLFFILLFSTVTFAAEAVDLSWVAPSEREDNTALSLTEIAGYKVYYGTSPGIYNTAITVNDSSATGYSVTGLPTGTYYFVVTTIDTEGRESQYSSAVTQSVNNDPEPTVIAPPNTVQEFSLSQGIVK